MGRLRFPWQPKNPARHELGGAQARAEAESAVEEAKVLKDKAAEAADKLRYFRYRNQFTEQFASVITGDRRTGGQHG